MKKKLIIASIIVYLFTAKAAAIYGQINDPIYDSIKNLNLNHYATLPVDSFLHAIPQSYDYIKILGSSKTFKVRGLCIYYPNTNLNIWIKPKQYLHMPVIDSNRIWNLTLFKKEIAGNIDVMHPQLPNLMGFQ